MTRSREMTTDCPDVSIIVAAFDAMPYVTRCIESIFSQTLGVERIEIITIDDGSNDGTGAELDRLAALCPTLRVVHQANSGSPAEPRNVGLGMATGRYIFFLDADDYLGPEAMERMVAAADANGADMVLGRLVGVNGRKAPRSIFRVNRPRADLFKSRVYWSLNPMKLFRRGHIEALGLRFATDLPWGEDMPFVTESYLNASVISIVADYDCVYLTYRDDGNNFTKRISSVSSRLQTPTILLDMIGRYVRPGRNRDYLMTRIFQLEIINILPRMAAEPDPELQRAAFETIKGWVDRWYTRIIARSLSPLHRVSLNLVSRGKMAEVIALFPEWPPAKAWGVIVDGKRVYADYPYFRDPALAIPDSCYEITRRLKAHCHVDEIVRSGGAVRITGHTYVDMIETLGMQVFAVLRRRGGGAEYAVPATLCPREGLGTEEWNRKITRENAGFEMVLDPTTIANGEPLPPAWWDLSVRVVSEGVTREAWMGGVSCKIEDGAAALQEVSLRQLDPDAVALGDESPLIVESAGWSVDDATVIEIAGRCDPFEAEPSSLSLLLIRRGGGEHRLKVEVADGRYVARVPLRSIAKGRPIGYGTWDVVLERREGDRTRIIAIPLERQPKVAYMMRGIWPARAQLGNVGPKLVLTSERIDTAFALTRARKAASLVKSVLGLRK